MPDARRSVVRLAIFAGILLAAAFVAWRAGLFGYGDPARLAAAIREARAITGIVPLFVALYALVTIFGLPGTPLTLAGGAIFGTALGSLLNWLGATLGAAGAYWLARGVGGGAIRALVGRHAGKLDRLTEGNSFTTILRLRLIPIAPFNVLNFAPALAGVRFKPYIAATALGIIPGTIIYTYFADSLIAGVEGAKRRALLHVAIAGALLIAISFLPRIIRGASRPRSSSA